MEGTMKKVFVLAVVVFLAIAACSTIPIASMVETNPNSRGDTFMKAVSALQGLGYRIIIADKETGIISAELAKPTSDMDRILWGSLLAPGPSALIVSMTIKDGEPGASIIDITVSHQPTTGGDSEITAKARDAILAKIRGEIKK
jgi:hypothetical protein